MSLTAGTRLGPYDVIDSIGRGGMGEVYRARDTTLDREVALKILPDAFVGDPERLARFAREAKTLAALNHPNIAQIFGVEESGGVRALVMELVPGQTLEELIAKTRAREGAAGLPLDETVVITRQIAEALETAHDAGIVHRDLKPANVKVRPDGVVKVLDFGLAKTLMSPDLKVGPTPPDPRVGTDANSPALDSNSPTVVGPTFRSGVSQIGVILGTASYMAPEQARGRVVDKRADIWALGAVWFEMLTGRSPFPGDTITDVIAAVVSREPEWTRLPASTPPAVRALIARCLEKDPRSRLRDIGEVRVALAGGVPREPRVPRPPSSRHGSLRPDGSRRSHCSRF